MMTKTTDFKHSDGRFNFRVFFTIPRVVALDSLIKIFIDDMLALRKIECQQIRQMRLSMPAILTVGTSGIH